MRSLAQWLDSYAQCHQNPTNIVIHHICVPAIQFSLLGLLWQVRLPLPDSWPYVFTNLAFVLVVLAIIYYFMLSWRLTLGMLLLTIVMLLVIDLLSSIKILMEVSISIFVTAWLAQFIGHKIEGKRPSFFEDMRFLLIGPLWVLGHLYTALGLSIDSGGQQ